MEFKSSEHMFHQLSQTIDTNVDTRTNRYNSHGPQEGGWANGRIEIDESISPSASQRAEIVSPPIVNHTQQLYTRQLNHQPTV